MYRHSTIVNNGAAIHLSSRSGDAVLREHWRIDMRDIAPTLAHLLAVELPAAEGRNVRKRE
jgi:hypothetical protein